MHPFEEGGEYRRPRLLEFLDSKQHQSGVLWGPREPGCLICTSGGRHSKKVGYTDGAMPDGTWLYVGQGQSGDQSLDNAANAKLAARERSVLLFTTREPTSSEVAAQNSYGKLFTFRGSFNVAAVETFVPDVGPRSGDRLLRFVLVPALDSSTAQASAANQPADAVDLATLQHRLSQEFTSAASSRLSSVEYRKRSAAVHRYAHRRAAGICEACHLPAPFLLDEGDPYLEVHHLRRLADDGPDAPSNVAAICPNCHRAVHLATNRRDIAQSLSLQIARREEQVAGGAN